MPGWLIGVFARIGVPERYRGLVLVLALLAALIGLGWWAIHSLDAYIDDQQTEAVASDRNTINAAVDNRMVQADRDAALNQLQADADFRNEQHNAQEAADEAARNRTSPLDALFNQLR